MIFTLIEVVKTKENFYYVEWDMSPTPPPPGGPLPDETIDDYKFQIHWSRDPFSGFLPVLDENGDPVEIDGAVGPLSYTHKVRQYDFNQDNYYKVLAIHKALPSSSLSPSASESPSPSASSSPSMSASPSSSPSASSTTSISSSASPSASASPSVEPPLPGSFFSDTVFIGMYSDGVHETMRYAEDLLYGYYHGEPCLIVKKKSFGARCPTCWDPIRQQRVRTHCDTCKGSGYVVGYYQAIREQVSFDSDPKKSDSQKEFENVFDTIRARLSNYPLVRPKDLIVNLDNNKRFVVSHVETTKIPKLSYLDGDSVTKVLSKQNYILSQLLTLEELNPDDNEYFLDVDHIPEVPLSDEGRTGSTIPYFNDHLPVTVNPPLKIDDGHQHVIFQYSTDDFQLVSGIFTLKNTVGMIGTSPFIAGEVITPALKAVFVEDDGKVYIANCLDKTQVDRVVGVALNEAAIDGSVVVQKMGRLSNPAWSWVVGKGIFFDENGNLTQTVPTNGYWMNIAKVITPTTIDLLLRLPIILVGDI
jgi:hypothetical protein